MVPARPHQPRVGSGRPSAEHDDANAPIPGGSPSPAASSHEAAAEDAKPWRADQPADDEPVRVRVNDHSKVSRVETGALQQTPRPGGRFSSWRRARTASAAADSAGAPEGAETSNGDPSDGPRAGHSGSTGDDAVVDFPPSPHRRRQRHRLFTALAAVLALALLAGIVFFSPLLAARDIRVEGARLTDPASVREALEGFEGVPLTRISKESVRQAVGDVPQVKSVSVDLEPPHTIVVRLHERVGIATVKDGNSVVLVDSQGKPLSTSGLKDTPKVPMIDGGTAVLSTEKFAAISDVLAALPAEVLEQLDTAAAPSAATVELTFRDGRTAVWGDASDSELKARVLAALVADPKTSAATRYDVSAPLHPVVK